MGEEYRTRVGFIKRETEAASGRSGVSPHRPDGMCLRLLRLELPSVSITRRETFSFGLTRKLPAHSEPQRVRLAFSRVWNMRVSVSPRNP